jgi:hypothetical protein
MNAEFWWGNFLGNSQSECPRVGGEGDIKMDHAEMDCDNGRSRELFQHLVQLRDLVLAAENLLVLLSQC